MSRISVKRSMRVVEAFDTVEASLAVRTRDDCVVACGAAINDNERKAQHPPQTMEIEGFCPTKMAIFMRRYLRG